MSKKNQIFTKLDIKENEIKTKDSIWFSLSLLVIIFIMGIMPYIVSGNLVGSHITSDSIKARQLAPDDLYVKRGFEYVDQKATEEKINQAIKQIYPIFTYDITSTYESLDRINTFNERVNDNYTQGILDSLVSLSPGEKDIFYKSFSKLNDKQKKMFSTWVYEIGRKIIRVGYFDREELKSVIENNYNKISLKGLLSDSFLIDQVNISNTYKIEDLITSNNIENMINNNIKDNSIYNVLPLNILYLAIDGLLKANVHYDLLESENAKDRVLNNIEDETVYVPAGLKVFSKDEIIRESDIELLKQVELNSAVFSNVQIFSRIILIIAITIFSLYWYFAKTNYTFRRVQFTYIYLILMIISLLFSLLITYYFSRFNLNVLEPFLPVLFGTLFLKNITNNRNFGFLFVIQYSLYSTLFSKNTFFSFFYLSVIGLSFLFIVDYEGDRISQIFNIFKGCVVAILMTFILYSIKGYPFDDFYYSIVIVLMNILFCFIFERSILPFVDNKLNIPTIFRLEELARLDNKLLTKLKTTAQGTYTHSVNVSDLAYDAALAIGANAEMCKVAALYHDLGKTEHPEYFTENQGDNYNKHDELTPSMSGSIIRSHVKLGVDLCKEEGLPKELLDIISEHHGNDVIQYFYNEAVKDSEKTYNKKVEFLDYSYNGNPPRSKESAILMIADSVEAAANSKRTSPQKVGRLISNIIRQKFDRSQLNDSHLDLTELKIIEKSLERSLVGKLHTRVKYQNNVEKTNNKE